MAMVETTASYGGRTSASSLAAWACDLWKMKIADPLLGCTPASLYSGLGPLPPILWWEGLLRGDKEGAQVHDKAGVHGHGPWHKAAAADGKSHRPPLAPEEIVAEPTMTSAWRVAPNDSSLSKLNSCSLLCSVDLVADFVAALLTAL